MLRLSGFFSSSLKTLLLTAVFAGFTCPVFSQTYTGEPNNRVTINMGETPWKFSKTDPYPGAKDSAYADGSWTDVAIPHCFNITESWLNVARGINGTSSVYFTAWYRRAFTIDAKYAGRRIELEFQGVNIGCAVYINGKFKQHIHKVAQPAEVTHVSGHLPFVVDITNDITFGASNVIAVRVSNDARATAFYKYPGIGTSVGFGMGFGGIHRPVNLHITDKVHVPLNVYSNIRRWGTYVATTAASEASATVRLQTNVYNDDAQEKAVTVTTTIVDANKNVVWTQKSAEQTVSAGANRIFDQTATIVNPKLWYPNNHPKGKPYMHRVYHIVQVDGKTVDVFESPLGIRVITWDKNYAYFNGDTKEHIFWGFGSRYEYPGFGSAVPEEQQWRDVKLIAECGGSMLRPGHVPAPTATVEACNAYGVCLFENTMDNEWALKGEPNLTYKDDYHRDCIIRDRNNPSIAVWELNNGCYKDNVLTHPAGWIKRMVDTIKLYDHFIPRTASTRDTTDYWPTKPGELILGKVWNYQRKSDLLPAWGAESWQSANARFSYDYEIAHTDSYVDEVKKVLTTSGLGLCHWMFMETGGEGYANFLDLTIDATMRKTLGCSAVDHNRIPKMVYRAYKNALWVPYSTHPGVALQSHWNYAAGNRTVTAYSNCPSVELFVNGVSKGVKTPKDTTRKCEWANVSWAAGTLRAEGRNAAGVKVCSDERKTAGAPSKIVLTVEPAIVRPDNGSSFLIRANGTDAAFILATIVDANGNWCPLATNEITFNASGQGTYVGSSNYLADASKPLTYHAVGSKQLAAEGGMIKVAVRSTFTPGSVTVDASAAGLTLVAPVTFTTVKVDSISPVTVKPAAITAQQFAGIGSRTFKTAGESFLVPGEFVGRPVSIKIYNLSGKLLRAAVVRDKRVSLRKYGISGTGMFIVRYSEVISTR